MSSRNSFALAAILTAAVAVIVPAMWAQSHSADGPAAVELLNVSYDPTRELWREINQAFITQQQAAGQTISIRQSHGSSGGQARAIIDGLDADVATLSMWSDTNAIHKQGLLQANWEERFPNRSLPYASTIVFVVRKGNPKQIKDWPDLIRKDVTVVTPNPKTSGNGKLSFLAAWGSVVLRGGTSQQAEEFVTELYHHTPVLDTGARGSSSTFAQKGIGDVHLTWENEARLELSESQGGLEIIYPPLSIQAEPHIAVVDSNVDRKGTRAAAEAYLSFLYTPEGQEIIARNYYRPANPDILRRHADDFPPLELFPITAITESWDTAHTRFFASNALFDSIYHPSAEK